jgi:hypothetical protein
MDEPDYQLLCPQHLRQPFARKTVDAFIGCCRYRFGPVLMKFVTSLDPMSPDHPAISRKQHRQSRADYRHADSIPIAEGSSLFIERSIHQ